MYNKAIKKLREKAVDFIWKRKIYSN
jgi:hypothetical protein